MILYIKVLEITKKKKEKCVFTKAIDSVSAVILNNLDTVLTSHLEVPIFTCRSHKQCRPLVLLPECNARTLSNGFNYQHFVLTADVL